MYNKCERFLQELFDVPHKCYIARALMKTKKALQVTGEQLQQVLQEVRGRITPEEGRALVSRALRDRDQADSDKWQVLPPHNLLLLVVCWTWGHMGGLLGLANISIPGVPQRHRSTHIGTDQYDHCGS